MRIFLNVTLLILLSISSVESKENRELNSTKSIDNQQILSTLKSEHAQLLKQLEQLTLKNKILKTKVKLKELSMINENYSNNINFETELQKLESDAKFR